MLRARIITAAAGLPVLLATVWWGDPWFSFLIGLAAVLGGAEFYRMLLSRENPLLYMGLAGILALVFRHYYQSPAAVLAAGFSGLAIVSLLLLLILPRENVFIHWAWTLAGMVYVGWMLSYAVELRLLDGGRGWTFWLLGVVFMNDSAAYFVGRTWGKRKLAPQLSPKKTWEGAIGGFVAGLLAGVAMGVLGLQATWPQMLALSIIVNVLAPLGGLVGSLLKRNMKVKDSGNLLPGHGGVLDRLDSLLFNIVVVYYSALWLAL